LLDDWRKLVGQHVSPDTGSLPWAQTAVLVDIDKTLLGPRGRGDQPINEARAEAAFRVARGMFGPDLDEQAFYTLYHTLCRSEFDPLTLDNQDYIVYTTMLMASGVLPSRELVADINSGRLATGTPVAFARLLTDVDARIPAPMRSLHDEIRTACAAGDPTPFKIFRTTEFAATVARMADGRLTLCRELMALLQWMTEQGALCMAVSDKPAESALPSEEQAEAGFLPLHRAPARVE
jgi:hypothetical protein